LSAAKAVRAALDQEAATIARIDVDVNPENGQLVLRGSVGDERMKKSIEEKTAQAAKGAKIDSQITVEKTQQEPATPASPAKPPAATSPAPREGPR
jgi:osmotically-inducible protein OsmY